MTPEDPMYRLFLLLHGQAAEPVLKIGQIPKVVAARIGWTAQDVYMTLSDAQKVRHHPMHGMDAARALALPMVIRHGDYYQSGRRGSSLQVEVVLHEADNPRRAYFLVLARDRADTGVFIRTFFFNSQLSRNKMRGARVLLRQSQIDYFKQE